LKRREFIASSAGVAGVIITGVGLAAVPCPPPQVSVAGGTSASTACPTGSVNTYSTDFNSTENPISDGGNWIDGKVVGLDWNNPRTTPGHAFASVLSGATGSRYDDSIAHLSTSFATFTANQFAQGTVFKVAGYGAASHEIELLLRFQTTAHNARGYEVLWGNAGYIAIVRWNGPVGNYTPLYDPGAGSISVPVDGDVLRAEIIGSTITVYKNGTRVATASDSTYGSGQPGMGFWPVDGATPQNLGLKSYQAGNL